MSNQTLILETHLHSQSSAWTRSFHLRLPQSATKSDILTLVRASLARLGLASPVVDAQITLYFTLNGRVLSLPGTSTVTTSTISIPVYNYNPPQILSLPPYYSQQPAWPLALTYANGINHLHTYGPAYQQHPQQTTTTLINPSGTLTFLNLALALPSSSAIGANRPVVSDVVRETRLDAVAEDALAGLLDWALGPNGLKLVLLVDVDGRDVLPAVVALPEPAPSVAPVPATPPPASSPPPPPAASDAEAAAAE